MGTLVRSGGIAVDDDVAVHVGPIIEVPMDSLAYPLRVVIAGSGDEYPHGFTFLGLAGFLFPSLSCSHCDTVGHR